MISDNPCYAPFKSIFVGTNGALSPCCAYNGSISHLDNESSVKTYFLTNKNLTTIRKMEKNKIWNLPACETCLNTHDSRKQRFSNQINRNNNLNNNLNVSVKHLDIAFSNTCNLSCVMCNSKFSSAWYKHDIAAGRPATPPTSRTYFQVDKILDCISKDTKVIEIKGGEPLYDPLFEYFLEELVKRGYTNLDLSINTNFTRINDTIFSLLNSIRGLNLAISIDGTDKTYEWIRGFSFVELEKLLIKFLPEFNHDYFVFTFTASIYNITNILNFAKWAKQLSHLIKKEIYLDFLIVREGHLSPLLANREESIRQITEIQEDPIFKNMLSNPYSLQNLKSFLENSSIDFDFEKRKHSEWHEFLISLRGWNFNDY